MNNARTQCQKGHLGLPGTQCTEAAGRWALGLGKAR